MMLSRNALLLGLIWTAFPSGSTAQFTCTFTASDENSCLGATGDDGTHCVWCAVSSYGFCVSENQAESMESNIPGIECDRYSSNDDDDGTSPSDDDAATDDDEAPKPNDDSLPDDYWTCLQKKDTESCVADGCTWCDSKGGFGMCMTGPSADMADKSDWFTCTKGDGNSFLSVADDPYDTSCLLAYLQDPSEDGCTSAVDEDGAACEYCSFQDNINLCLTEEQAEMGQQIGIECGSSTSKDEEPAHLRGSTNEDEFVKDPMDPSCALAYLQDQSEEACKAAVDSDGNPCEYCTLQGAINLCLNQDQAEAGEQLGIECDDDASATRGQVALPSDFWECLQNYDEEGCSENSCTWCNTEVGVGFCLADAAADATHDCTFFDCDFKKGKGGPPADATDPFDPACLAAGADSEDAESNCNGTMDSSGNSCVWCDAAGVFGLCLSAEQAAIVGKDYLTCGNAKSVLAIA